MQGTWENGKFVLASTKDDKITRLENEKKMLIETVELLLDVSWNGPIDSNNFARHEAVRVLKLTRKK
jgi:ElaB/YqjD/DUF883 family membrane-anchored ribosome-binding protein